MSQNATGHTQEEWQEAMLFHNRQRSRLSNERTFLAWVRTSLALITLGFVVQRFDVLLASAGIHMGHIHHARILLTWIPMLFFILGGIIIALGAWEFFRLRKEIQRQQRIASAWLRYALILTTLVFLLAVLVLFVVARP